MPAERGEPSLSLLTTRKATQLLTEYGLHAVGSVGERLALPDELWRRDDALRPAALSMIPHATVRARAGW